MYDIPNIILETPEKKADTESCKTIPTTSKAQLNSLLCGTLHFDDTEIEINLCMHFQVARNYTKHIPQ